MQERRDEMKEKLIEELKEGEVRHGTRLLDLRLRRLRRYRRRGRTRPPLRALLEPGAAPKRSAQGRPGGRCLRPRDQPAGEARSPSRSSGPRPSRGARSATSTKSASWCAAPITQLANFGAFARIEDGIEGLIHVSELTDERITHPKQIVKEGDELILRIIRIDPQRRRMGLSLRRALDTPDQELMAVFGEDVLAERDQIVANINAALEAEGIEPGSGREDEEEEETGRGACSPRLRPRSPRTSRASITESTNGDQPMSAMQAAFAAAGAIN